MTYARASGPAAHVYVYSVYTLVVGGVCLLHLWEFGSPNPVYLTMRIV